MRIATRPLYDWPGEMRHPRQRRRGPFSASWGQTQELLEREARMIGGREVVIQLAVTESDIRRDGWPYARAQTRHPGVTVVVPETRHGRLSWSTDRYDRWQDNVRAIALSMEALRAADRHGVMQGRQYAGFRELGTGEPGEDWQPTVEEAAQFIAGNVGPVADSWKPMLERQELIDDAYRRAAKRLHPDVGGDPAQFRRLQIAKLTLSDHGEASS